MKKYILSILLILSATTASLGQADITLKVGGAASDELKNVDYTIGLDLAYSAPVRENLNLGAFAGVNAYIGQKRVNGANDLAFDNFYLVPFGANALYEIGSFQIGAKGGFSLIQNVDTHGINGNPYWSPYAGVEFKPLVLRVWYESVKDSSQTLDLTYNFSSYGGAVAIIL